MKQTTCRTLMASVAVLVLCWTVSASATPLYTAKSGRTCDNCHSLPNTWFDPPDISKRKCTLSCAGCHVDPSGGGLRNTSGRFYGRATLALFAFEERPLEDRDLDLTGLLGFLDRHGDKRTEADKPGSEPTSGKVEPTHDRQVDPRPEGSPVPDEGPAFGRPYLHGSSEMAWLDGRYGDLNADPLLQLGGDLRLAYWSQGPLFFPMQLDAHAALHPVEHLTFMTTVGARGRTKGFEATANEEHPITIRDLWVMTHEWPYLSYARAGRFLPSFGNRYDDHTIYTRRPFGLSQEDPGNRVIGAEVGFTGNYPYGNFSLFKPALRTGNNPLATDEGFGGVLSVGWRDLGWSVGASGMVRRRPLEGGGDTMDLSLQWSLNPWRWIKWLPLTYMGEAAVGLWQRPFSGTETSQLAVYHQLSWSMAPGVTLHGRYDFWDPDRAIIEDEIHRPGVALELVLIPGLSVRTDVRFGLPVGGELGDDGTMDAFVQLHGWF